MASALLAPLRGPLLALVSSLVGAYLAWTWFAGSWTVPVLLGAVLLLASIGSQALGAGLLPRRPLAAVRLMNATVLAQVLVLAVVASATIVVTVSFAAGEDASTESTQLLAAVVSAVTTFLAGAIVSTDKSDDAIGAIVQSRFNDSYATLKPADPDSAVRFEEVDGKYLLREEGDGWNTVFSNGWRGLSGWDRDTRLTRARWLTAYLAGEQLPEA